MNRQLPWMKDVRTGSVLVARSGRRRIVRKVHRNPNGTLYAVVFVIAHCSWTGRCYTYLQANDLIQCGYRLSRATPRRLRGTFNARIRKAINQPGYQKKKVLTCCDVEGIA